jgi:hypothetical protein
MATAEPPHARAYHELLEALSQEGCPICRLGWRVAERYLDGLLYENVNDPGVREGLRAARGFCYRHAWALTAVRGCSLGVAILYRDVLHTVIEELARDSGEEKRVLGWSLTAGAEKGSGRLAPQAPCPACVQQEEMERIYLRELLRRQDDPHLWPAFAASSGLCLPHLRQALRQTEDDRQRQELLSVQGEIWKRLQHDLDEFIRKNDYRFRHEGFGVEADSWLRALAAISGNR